MKKVFISILAVLVLLVTLVPAAAFALTTGESTGSFTVGNVAPTITSVEIIPAGGGSAVTGMTPGVAYKAKIVAGDANTVEDIDQVRVAIVFDGTDADPTADPGEVGNTQNLACLKWVKSSDTWSISPVGGDTTWSLTPASCTKPGNMSLNTGTWEFYFMVGKVATVGSGGNGNPGWDLFGEVKDEGTPVEAWGDRDLSMDWYGEITVGNSTVDWGSVTPGTGFADGVNEQGGISVKYIANGNYQEQVKSEASWTGITQTATFDEGGSCATANEFSLKAYTSDTFGSAVQVTLAGATIDNAGTQTVEAGNTVATNDLWLKLASVFTIDTYSGTITYVVANR